MLLRNYDNIMTRLRIYDDALTPADTHNGEFLDTTKLNLKQLNGIVSAVSGTYYNFSFTVPFSQWGTSEKTASSSWLFAGSSDLDCYGNIGVSYDDYTLGKFDTTPSSLSDSISISKPYFDETENCWCQVRKQSYMANCDMIIKEIGVSHASTSTSVWYVGNAGYDTAILVYREVLENPIEVKSGQIYTITFTIKSSILDNKPADYQASISIE